MDLGKNFKHYRKLAKLTQKEAAKEMGINSYQLANYETNRSEPSIAILKKMSVTYGVSIDRLVRNRQMPSVKPIKEEYTDLNELLDNLTELVNKYNNNKDS